jgi:hypothetical protein
MIIITMVGQSALLFLYLSPLPVSTSMCLFQHPCSFYSFFSLSLSLLPPLIHAWHLNVFYRYLRSLVSRSQFSPHRPLFSQCFLISSYTLQMGVSSSLNAHFVDSFAHLLVVPIPHCSIRSLHYVILYASSTISLFDIHCA